MLRLARPALQRLRPPGRPALTDRCVRTYRVFELALDSLGKLPEPESTHPTSQRTKTRDGAKTGKRLVDALRPVARLGYSPRLRTARQEHRYAPPIFLVCRTV